LGSRQFANNATALLAGTITNTSTTIQVATGAGALFPSLSGTEYFIGTINDTAGNVEYFKCTAISGDNLTVVRGQEGTTALGFTANLARVEYRMTAGQASSFLQKDGDTLTGPLNGGGQTITNAVLGTSVSMESASEIVNTPIRGATGVTTNQITVPSNGSRPQIGGVNISLVTDPTTAFTIGMIMLWNEAIGNVPAGWQICDGTNGTPDLRDKFVVGAGNSYTLDESVTLTVATTSVSAGTPTINPVTLTVGNLPSHAHPFDYFFGNSAAVIYTPGGGPGGNYIEGGGGSGTRVSFAGSSTGSGTSFTPTAAALGGHSHSVSLTNAVAIYYIMYVG